MKVPDIRKKFVKLVITKKCAPDPARQTLAGSFLTIVIKL
jgi:hypothetical protein